MIFAPPWGQSGATDFFVGTEHCPVLGIDTVNALQNHFPQKKFPTSAKVGN